MCPLHFARSQTGPMHTKGSQTFTQVNANLRSETARSVEERVDAFAGATLFSPNLAALGTLFGCKMSSFTVSRHNTAVTSEDSLRLVALTATAAFLLAFASFASFVFFAYAKS